MRVIRTFTPSPLHQALMADFKAVLAKHGDDLAPADMLAIASQLVGNLIALQDQTKYSVDACMDIVGSNIEVGNRTAISTFLGDTVGKA